MQRALTRDKEAEPRPAPNVKDWQSFRAAESKIDPKVMKADLTELWQHADTGQAFAAALHDRGYILARGDRRDFCVIDQAGDEHALGRRISGVKAAEIRARMADLDPANLPSVEEGRQLARERLEAHTEGGTPAGATAQGEVLPAALAAPTAAEEPAAKPSAFDAIMAERMQEAEEQAAQMIEEQRSDVPADRFARVRAWWGTMREYVADDQERFLSQWNAYFGRGETEEPQPTQPTSPEP